MKPSAADVRQLIARPRARFLWPVLAALVVFGLGWGCATTYVLPYEVGVKQVILGGDQGIQPTLYGPGLHWVTPFAQRMYTLPSDVQALEMTTTKGEVAESFDQRVVAPIQIQTSEGYTVSVDMTVLYRIEDPYKVITQIGPGRLYEDAAVIPRSEQVLRRTLGELDAEEFYRGDSRETATNEAKKLLEEELAPKGIRITHVLVRQYRYDQRYQQAIEQRKIQDQTVFKNIAEAAVATAEAERNRIVAEGAAFVQTELARGEAEVQKIHSEAELYRRTKAAEGELLVRVAHAQGTELENQALRGSGSENMVGLKMAEVLKGTRVIVIPTDGEGGTNPLDLGTTLRRFDVRGGP